MPITYPIDGQQYRIALTGYATPIQLNGAACKSVVLAANQAIAGLSGGASTDNAGTVLVGVGAAPVVTTQYVGIPLFPSAIQEIVVTDASKIWVAGLVGDYVVVTILN